METSILRVAMDGLEVMETSILRAAVDGLCFNRSHFIGRLSILATWHPAKDRSKENEKLGQKNQKHYSGVYFLYCSCFDTTLVMCIWYGNQLRDSNGGVIGI